jgi:3-oxoacyl-[acyl-carrier-protein] synthase-1
MSDLAVIGGGMVTAAGFNARSTAAAVRAGISGIQLDNIWDSTAGDYMAVGRPRTPQWWEGPEMLAELAAPAIAECYEALRHGEEPDTIPILLLLSTTERPFRDPDLERVVPEGLESRLGFPMPEGSQIFNLERTGLFDALRHAARMFDADKGRNAVIVGADTFLRQRVVEAYIERRRVLTADNSNGFIPGEAACAALVAPPDHHAAEELRIVGYGRGREKGTIESDDPLTGDGLTEAMKTALGQAGITMDVTDQWLTDQNAEEYRVRECTVAQIRLERRTDPTRQPYQIQHPVEYLGEIGAAIGPCLLKLALAAHRSDYAHGARSLLTLGEDNGDRVALVLRWVQGSRQS